MTVERKINPPRHMTQEEVRVFNSQLCNIINKMADMPDDSTATTVAGLVVDFNALLQRFRDLTTEVVR